MIPVIPSGILNVDKPAGITSHDVVDVLRKVLKEIISVFLLMRFQININMSLIC